MIGSGRGQSSVCMSRWRGRRVCWPVQEVMRKRQLAGSSRWTAIGRTNILVGLPPITHRTHRVRRPPCTQSMMDSARLAAVATQTPWCVPATASPTCVCVRLRQGRHRPSHPPSVHTSTRGDRSLSVQPASPPARQGYRNHNPPSQRHGHADVPLRPHRTTHHASTSIAVRTTTNQSTKTTRLPSQSRRSTMANSHQGSSYPSLFRACNAHPQADGQARRRCR